MYIYICISICIYRDIEGLTPYTYIYIHIGVDPLSIV